MFSKSAVILETGPVVDQTFAGGQPIDETLQVLRIGGGVNANTFNSTAKTTITLTQNEDTTYNLKSAGFGKINWDKVADLPGSGYFQGLGYPNQTQHALIAPNFVGLGLPKQLWFQTVNLLYKVDLTFDDDLTCDASQGGMCHLANPCDQYTGAFNSDWSFRFDMSTANDNDYMLIPLAALAVNNTMTGQCDIYLQYLDPAQHTQSDHVIFGSLVLQLFKNYWEYDLAASPPTTTLHIQLSDTNTISPSYIGSDTYSVTSTPFTALYGAVEQIYVNTDPYHYKTTIGGSLGFFGQSQFQVSLLGNQIMTFSTDCLYQKAGTKFRSCDQEPVEAILYFDPALYMTPQTTEYTPTTYAGYNTSGDVFSSEVCMRTAGVSYFCTVFNQQLYVADAVYNNYWAYGQKAEAGIIGLGAGSPVWSIVGPVQTKLFDVYMTNVNFWTWAQPDYVKTTANSVINFGTHSTDYSSSDPSISINPSTGGSYLFDLYSFGFGMTNTTNNSQWYEDINNFDSDPLTYGILANSTSFSLDFRGLGLPTKSFNKFANLLAVATKGESTCLERQSGYCVLTQKCSAYRKMGLWDFDFRIQFDNSAENYLRVPLATFAADYEKENACVIFVEYLDDRFQNSQSIQFGGLFWQSVYGQYTLTNFGTTLELFINKNALDMTYLGSDIVPLGQSPFVVPVVELMPDPNTETSGLPTFSATVAGITDPEPYFLLDFESSHTVVWSTQCQTTGIGIYPAGPCSNNPTFMHMGFDGSPLPEQTGTFSSAQFGGYVVSGTKFASEVCFGGVNCKIVDVYGVDQVSQDNWLYNKDGTYGILGMGPTSFIWEGFVDPDLRTSTYSISLARLGKTGSSRYTDGVSATSSNITFGGANADWYAGKTNILMTALPNFTYAVSNFTFGRIYETDGVASSEYFQALGNTNPVLFSTNFKGLGLPANIYTQFVSLLEYVTNYDVVCEDTVDGICSLPSACGNYTALNEFSFKVQFANEVTGNYIRVPLAIFAYNVLIG